MKKICAAGEKIDGMKKERLYDIDKGETALIDILDMEKRLPEDFDYKKELQEARLERYDNFN